MYKDSNNPISAECELQLQTPFSHPPDIEFPLFHPHVGLVEDNIEPNRWMIPSRFEMIIRALLECLDLELRTVFFAPPDYSFTISGFAHEHESTLVKSMEVKRWIILGWFEIIMRVLLSSSFLSALAAVAILRSYPRLRLLLSAVWVWSALACDRAMNRGRGSYQPGNASNGCVSSKVSPVSGRPPATSLHSRRLKKHFTYSERLDDCKNGEG